MAKIKFEIEGMEDIVAGIKALGELPQRTVTPAARAGAAIAYKDAKANAPGGPHSTGALKSGIILKPERTRVKGKKVYDVIMDPKMNDTFVKTTKTGKRAYYPASMEYGFIMRDGKKKEGTHFLKNAIEKNANQIERAMVEKLVVQLDKQLKKMGSGK